MHVISAQETGRSWRWLSRDDMMYWATSAGMLSLPWALSQENVKHIGIVVRMSVSGYRG